MRLHVFGKNVLEVFILGRDSRYRLVDAVPISVAFRQIQRIPEPSRFGEVENALCLVFGLADLPTSAALLGYIGLGPGKLVIGGDREISLVIIFID